MKSTCGDCYVALPCLGNVVHHQCGRALVLLFFVGDEAGI